MASINGFSLYGDSNQLQAKRAVSVLDYFTNLLAATPGAYSSLGAPRQSTLQRSLQALLVTGLIALVLGCGVTYWRYVQKIGVCICTEFEPKILCFCTQNCTGYSSQSA